MAPAYRKVCIGIIEGIPDQAASFTWYVSVLFSENQHKLCFVLTSQCPSLHFLQRVIALSECCSVNVCRKEADTCSNPWIERCLEGCRRLQIRLQESTYAESLLLISKTALLIQQLRTRCPPRHIPVANHLRLPLSCQKWPTHRLFSRCSWVKTPKGLQMRSRPVLQSQKRSG